ncbi:DUF977 family protein [Reyranella sp.]|uniref:DUF977 family protein n=1 Tax=Reyranella sp. TaxID=1929291 RepID=UPI003BAA545D
MPALRRTQTTLRDEAPDWEPWVGFFLGCLKKQKDGLALRLDRERIARRDEDELSDLSRRVLAALRAQDRLTTAQLAALTGANRNTLKVRLRELVLAGRVRRHGAGDLVFVASATRRPLGATMPLRSGRGRSTR